LCRTGLWTHLWRELRTAERRRVGKVAHPSAAIMDSQSVKTVEESARIRGYDAHKHVKGRKRHILVDTLGLPLSVYVTPADMHDTQGARRLLAGLKYFVPRLKTIWADAAYRGQDLADWCKAEGDWDLNVVERTPGVRGFAVLPKRWIVEIVQSQMTKANTGAITRCGKDVANRDLAIGHNDAINEQFDQRSPLLEGGLAESRAYLGAEALQRLSDRAESDVLAR